MIREFEQSDVEELIDVWRQSTTVAHPFMDKAFLEKEEKNTREVYIPNTKTWVYPNNKGLDGFISMIGSEVGAIFVRPEKFGQGIGRQLMDFVSSQFEELEVQVFKNNKIGCRFYRNYGFVVVDEYVHEETGQFLLRMKFAKNQ